MAIIITRISAVNAATKISALAEVPPSIVQAAVKPKKKATHTKARPIDHIDFSQPGLLQVGHLMTAFGISHSGLYQRIKQGQIPPPDGHFGRNSSPDDPGKKVRRTPWWYIRTIAPRLGG